MSGVTLDTTGRPVGRTEYAWCRGVPGGTGIAVLAILLSKSPNISRLKNALHSLQTSHPILNSKLQSNTTTNLFSFLTFPQPFIQIKSFNMSTTCAILETKSKSDYDSISPFHLILEHELNQNSWCNPNRSVTSMTTDVFFASIYALPNEKWVVVLRLHVSACDRTTAVSLLRELLVLIDENDIEKQLRNKGELSLGLEDLIPKGSVKKALWTRGKDMLGYTLDSLRMTNLTFTDAKSKRFSEVVRLQMTPEETERILAGCRTREIKLCGALVAAALMGAHTSKRRTTIGIDNQSKYSVATLVDCRSSLEPALSDHHFGFYHSVIQNTHVVKGGEKLWELAKKCYISFSNAKKCNKHFSDMADLNLLMCKAIENPSLTSSSSLRTSFISVFEDTVIDNSSNAKLQVGLEDYMGCASIHGIGPSMAIFDTIRDGRLDCICVYPSPLHSRKLIQQLVDKMKFILVNADN